MKSSYDIEVCSIQVNSLMPIVWEVGTPVIVDIFQVDCFVVSKFSLDHYIKSSTAVLLGLTSFHFSLAAFNYLEHHTESQWNLVFVSSKSWDSFSLFMFVSGLVLGFFFFPSVLHSSFEGVFFPVSYYWGLSCNCPHRTNSWCREIPCNSCGTCKIHFSALGLWMVAKQQDEQ